MRIQHGYDRAGNRLWRQDPVALANSANLEDLYTYDGVNQLKHRDRGALNANKDAVTSKNFAEDWTLDMTGNWPTFKQDTDGNGTWDLDQSRTHDKANELTEIAGSNTHVAEDLAGNMTKTPKPTDWSAHFDLTYDAWNRLVKVMDGEATVATYAYDARNFRITKTTSGTTRHYYYSSDWQVLEDRIGTSTYSDRQNIWGIRYVDDLLLRDRDADANTGTGNLGVASSSLEERLYCLQDPNWNAAAIAGTDGAIQERYSYTAYGQPACFTSTFGSQPSSNFAWDTLYTGRQYDAETGIYHYRNRYYGAELGRFVSRDPIGYGNRLGTIRTEDDESTAFSLYRYSDNSPISNTDPLGLVTVWPFPPIDIPPTWPIPRFPRIPLPHFPRLPRIPMPSNPLNYGHYCGPTNMATCDQNGQPDFTPPHPNPIDGVDLACAYHDCCLPTVKEYLDECHHRACNMVFCARLLAADCSRSPSPPKCETYRHRALNLCALTINWRVPLP